jgi:predicted P-loop ATPase
MTEEKYDIRKRLSVLTRSKESNTKYHCPACGKNDFDIDPKTGKYCCFSGGCDKKDIRAAIDKLEGKPEWKPTQDNWQKPIRPNSEKEYFYPARDGKQLVKVLRIDYGDGKKDCPQSHWNGSKWIKTNPAEIKKQIPIYRYGEVQQAIGRNELVFWVEGEDAADLLWDLGIAATTTIGGSVGYKTYGDYQEDLKGARLALAPDRDTSGVKYISQVAKDFATQVESYYLAGTQGLWKKPQGGMDIADDIRDRQLTKEQILSKVISPGEYQEAIAPKVKETTGHTMLAADYPSLAKDLGILLVQDDKGNIKSKLVELTMDLYNLVGDSLKLNQMTQEYEYEGKPLDLNHVKNFISHNLGYDSSTENCIQAVHAIASKFTFHPVRKYLESLRDKTLADFDVLNNIATLFLGNSDPLANKMMAKALIGAIARVNKPGTKVDTLPVLQGGQGFLKSTFLKVLAGEFWFCDDIRDLENKDELAKLARYWIIELAEVDYLMGRKEVESFKRFLSTTADTYRPPYGRANIRHERTCTLFATTNKIEFLKDPTGSRRYWVIKVGGKIDCDLVAKFRDIIWGTALAAYERGDIWWLDDDDELAREERSEEFREPDAWEEIIASKWGSLPMAEYNGSDCVEINRIFDLLDLDNDKRNKPNRNRIASILKLWGFENKTINTDAGKVKTWLRPRTGVDFNKEELTKNDDFKNKVLGKYSFLGSSSSIISSTKGFEVELNLELNPLDNEKKEYPQNSSQHGKNLELNLEPNYRNLELNYKQEILVVGSELSSTGKESSSRLSLIPELFSPQWEVNPTILEPELSSTSTAVSEGVLPLLEPKNLRKEPFHIGQKNNSEEITRFKLDDRVQYIGQDKALQTQYAGILKVRTIDRDQYTCVKPGDESLTSWIEREDLQLVEVAS